MDVFRIIGPTRLEGNVQVSGAKNAALPILAATILADQPVRLQGVPRLTDINTLCLLLGHLGVEIAPQLNGDLLVDTVDDKPTQADAELVRSMRASFCVLGPLVARRGRAVVPLPGGCRIGDRPVDLHLQGLAALGADIRIVESCVVATANRLIGARIHMSGPDGPTVTGTANVMCAAALARGSTIITGAAREPEIVDLGNFLTSLGAQIDGLGTPTIEVDGVTSLNGTIYKIIPDRIEGATLLIAGAITQGRITVNGVIPEHLAGAVQLLSQTGASLESGIDQVTISSSGRPTPLELIASPYPGLSSDLQAQFTALLALASGQSTVRDDVFRDRFGHVNQLNRMGARINRSADLCVIRGVQSLQSSVVEATDLRASAALVLAGLAAEGTTIVERIDHLDRGYERLEEKLRSLGATIERLADLEEPTGRLAAPAILPRS